MPLSTDRKDDVPPPKDDGTGEVAKEVQRDDEKLLRVFVDNSRKLISDKWPDITNNSVANTIPGLRGFFAFLGDDATKENVLGGFEPVNALKFVLRLHRIKHPTEYREEDDDRIDNAFASLLDAMSGASPVRERLLSAVFLFLIFALAAPITFSFPAMDGSFNVQFDRDCPGELKTAIELLRAQRIEIREVAHSATTTTVCLPIEAP